MGDDSEALVLFGQATNAVRASNLIDKEDIERFGVAGMRAVDAALKENNIWSAIDTAEKTRAIESYLLFQKQHERLAMADVNRASKWHLKIIRKIGEWLDGHVAKGNPNLSNGGDISTIGISTEETKVYLDEIGISKDKSADWQRIARMPEEEFEEFTAPFLKPENEVYLSPNKVLTHLSPAPEKPPVNPAVKALDDEMKGIGLPSSGTKVYDLLKRARHGTRDYLKEVNDETAIRQLYFMSAMFRSVGQLFAKTADELDKRIHNGKNR
jgi:hypothetical protein